jgi:hypothetical protein
MIFKLYGTPLHEDLTQICRADEKILRGSVRPFGKFTKDSPSKSGSRGESNALNEKRFSPAQEGLYLAYLFLKAS